MAPMPNLVAIDSVLFSLYARNAPLPDFHPWDAVVRRLMPGADQGGVQGVRTPALLFRCPF